jgi:DNA-directed RNA polymerase alpha subunit
LENSGITPLWQLFQFSETDILKLHGFGPGSLPKLKAVLKDAGLSFKM